MEERDQILIERYLADELTDAERHEVELRKQEDPVFRQQVHEYEIARQVLQAGQRKELRERMARLDAVLNNKKPVVDTPDRKRFWWIWVAAALLVALLLGKFIFMSGPSLVPVQPDPEDSIRLKQLPADRLDTLVPREEWEKEEVKKSREQYQDMAGKDSGHGDVFAEYFEPYKDAMMDPTMRGDEEISPLQKYQKAYWDGEYQKSVGLFTQLPPASQGNDNLRFSYANALLETGKTDQAISILESIIKNDRSRYVTEAYFELAMCQLKKGNSDHAKDWLVKYINLEKAKRKDQADEIIHKLSE